MTQTHVSGQWSLDWKKNCVWEDTLNTQLTPWLRLGFSNDKGEDLTGANQYHADQGTVEY